MKFWYLVNQISTIIFFLSFYAHHGGGTGSWPGSKNLLDPNRSSFFCFPEVLSFVFPKFFLFLVLTDMLSQGLPKSDICRQAVSKVGSFFGVDLFLKNI